MDTAATQQHKTGRERRTFARLDAERRRTEAEALRAAARDVTLAGPMDVTQTAEWLMQRAHRAEHPEPLKPLHPLVLAAWVIGIILLSALVIVGTINGDFNYVRPL